MNKLVLALVSTVVLLSACTWNKQTRKGERVDLVKSVYIGSCKYLGTVEAKVTKKIGGVTVISKKNMSKELTNLGKNNAAEMGGDTIVFKSRIKNGHRTFKVYRCKR